MYFDVKQGMTVKKQGMAYLARERKDHSERLRGMREFVLPLLMDLSTCPNWGDVKGVSCYGYSVSLFLKRDRKDSPLPREIAQLTHSQGKKSAGEESLEVSFVIPRVNAKGKGVDMYVTVNGYLPATCRIERIEEYIPGHVGYVNKVVCTGGTLEEE